MEGRSGSAFDALSKAGNLKKENILQQLHQLKAQRATAAKNRWLQGKIHSGGTTLVTIQNESGEWVDLTDKREIEAAILKNNTAKFQQSFHMPFMRPPISTEFGFKGLTWSSQAVLPHVYIPHPDLNTHVVDLLDALHTPASIKALGKVQFNLLTST
jgi:hypothetical protein